jgi:hypothetical protein
MPPEIAEAPAMSSVTTQLAEVLSTVRRPGDYFVSGTVEMLAPRLEVDGVGPVALPLLPVQASELIAAAERAPYGRGDDTVIDTQVRRTWQIGPDRVRIGGKHWSQTLEAILDRVAEGLGVSDPIDAEFYKLLIYDEGSFFVNHRDTEKAAGMFATLVVVLPSVSTGGELIVRHKDREATLDLRCEEPSEAAFAAFYADCVHEVRPITSGCRLALVYNLLRKGKEPKLQPPSYEDEQGRVAALLRSWAARKRSPDEATPEKLIYPLEHAYTPAELGFDKLKGADSAIASVLANCAPQAGCDLHLALLSIEETGAAEYTGNYSRRGRRSDEEEFEAGEVYERDVGLSEWRRPDGKPSELSELRAEDGEICPPNALEDLDPDEEDFHEATGNEGASFERTYRRAALVLWPRERVLAVLNQAGLSVTLPYLENLTERWAVSGEDRTSALWAQAHELAGHMLSTWPRGEWYGRDDKLGMAGRMLSVLARLRDAASIETFISSTIASTRRGKGDNEALLGALRVLSPDRAASLLKGTIAATAATSLDACGDLLARAVAAFPDGTVGLHGAAAVLVCALPGDPSRAPQRQPWEREAPINPGFLVDLFNAVSRVDEVLAERAADHILSWPKTYDVDSVLVPAMRKLIEAPVVAKCSAVERLRAACLAHLRARAAEPLEPPPDWARPNTLACHCANCTTLARFLADPKLTTWVFKVAQTGRDHVEQTIGRAQCDLDMRTDHRGRPYSLICTKNRASYDRRMKQRKQDLADLERLEP